MGQRVVVNKIVDIDKPRLGEAAIRLAKTLKRPSLEPFWFSLIIMVSDLPVLAVTFWFVQYATLPTAVFSPLGAAISAILAAGLAISVMATANGYLPRVMMKLRSSLRIAFLALTVPVFFLALWIPRELSVELVRNAAPTLAVVVGLWRYIHSRGTGWIFETGLLHRRAVIAGGGRHAERLIRRLAARSDNDITIHGIFDDRTDDRVPAQTLGVPKLGGYEDLIGFTQASEIDMVIISLPMQAENRIDWLLKKLSILPVDVRMSAFSRDFSFSDAARDALVASPIRRSFTPSRRLKKRAFDMIFGVMALFFTLPVIIAAAIAVRIDSPGPVFFRQRRHGYNQRVIDVWKFRTMYHHASDPDARTIVTRGDPRVTRVGRFLRKSSIDELPQLFNVLQGDLSLVGPRPHAVEAVSSGREKFSRIIDGYAARHRLPPGITGWAQINGWRGEIDDPAKLRERFKHDLYYIENWSVLLDLKILFRTPVSLLNTKSAY